MTRNIQLSKTLRDRLETSGLTDEALSRALKMPREQVISIREGKQEPTGKFMASVWKAGMATSFDDIVALAPEPQDRAA